MTDLVRATRVEVLKLRRTLALWTAFLAPLLIVVMTTALNFSRDTLVRAGSTTKPWDALMLNLILLLWCLLGLPLFVTLETALLAGVEHREGTWKHLFTLPPGRWTIYTAKLLVALGLVVISSCVIAAGTAGEGVLLLTLRPAMGLTEPVPWDAILSRTLLFTIGAFLVACVQAWVAIRWRSFVVPLAVGIAGSIVGLILSTSPRGGPLAAVFPWSLPYAAVARPNLAAMALVVGIGGGIIVAALGCWEAIRREAA